MIVLKIKMKLNKKLKIKKLKIQKELVKKKVNNLILRLGNNNNQFL